MIFVGCFFFKHFKDNTPFVSVPSRETDRQLDRQTDGEIYLYWRALSVFSEFPCFPPGRAPTRV